MTVREHVQVAVAKVERVMHADELEPVEPAGAAVSPIGDIPNEAQARDGPGSSAGRRAPTALMGSAAVTRQEVVDEPAAQ